MRDVTYREFRKQTVDERRAVGRIGLDQLGGGADVLLRGEPAEDRRFLGQVADAEPGSAIHRQARDVVAIERDRAVIGSEQAGDQIEASGLARAIGTQQPYDLAALQREADPADNGPAAEALADARDGQPLKAFDDLRERPLGAGAKL